MHLDFHAYAEVWLGGRWHTFDARFNVPRIGRIKVASGLDAVDGALSLGDPIDLSKRLDNRWEVLTALPAA